MYYPTSLFYQNSKNLPQRSYFLLSTSGMQSIYDSRPGRASWSGASPSKSFFTHDACAIRPVCSLSVGDCNFGPVTHEVTSL